MLSTDYKPSYSTYVISIHDIPQVAPKALIASYTFYLALSLLMMPKQENYQR